VSSNVAENKAKNEREPLLREKLRRSLVEAGADGKTAHQLAQEFYGESNLVTRRRIHGLVTTLRWNGVKIIRVKDEEFLIGRYVLAQFVIAAESQP
jgi:hypothetical protein